MTKQTRWVREMKIHDSLNMGRKIEWKRKEELKNLSEEEKLNYELGVLKSQLKNTEEDMKNFKDNMNIRNKINNLKERIIKKENKIKEENDKRKT